MADPYDALLGSLRALPGLGKRSAERIALHLLVGDRSRLGEFVGTLETAAREIDRCPDCGNLARVSQRCAICADPRRETSSLCIVEKVQDLAAMEEAGGWKGL